MKTIKQSSSQQTKKYLFLVRSTKTRNVISLWQGLKLKIDYGLFRVLGLKYAIKSPYGFKICIFSLWPLMYGSTIVHCIHWLDTKPGSSKQFKYFTVSKIFEYYLVTNTKHIRIRNKTTILKILFVFVEQLKYLTFLILGHSERSGENIKIMFQLILQVVLQVIIVVLSVLLKKDTF